MDRNDANALSERLIELWNAHDVEGIADLYANTATLRDAANPDNVASGRDGIIAGTRLILDGFSDARLELLTRLTDGDLLAIEWRFTGTQDGEFLGVLATGQPTENGGASISRVGSDGKIASETAHWDLASFLRQTGVLPAVAEGAVRPDRNARRLEAPRPFAPFPGPVSNGPWVSVLEPTSRWLAIGRDGHSRRHSYIS